MFAMVLILVFFHHPITKLLSEESTVPRALFKARKVAGSATCRQSKLV